MLTPEQIKQNYENHLKYIEEYVDGDRKEKILTLVEDFGDNYVMSPNSTKKRYVKAYPGGYVDHINKVTKYVVKLHLQHEKMGYNINYDISELIFCSLFYNIGKLGTPDNPLYIEQDDKWRRDTLGEEYKINTDLPYMKVQDRSIFTLQNYGIKLTPNEYITIKTSNGMYEDSNTAYYRPYNPDFEFKTVIPYLLHTADSLISKIDLDDRN